MKLFDIFKLGEHFTILGKFHVGSVVISDNGITGTLKKINNILMKNSIGSEVQNVIKSMIVVLKDEYKSEDGVKKTLTEKGDEDLSSFWIVIYTLLLFALKDRVVFSAYLEGDLNTKKLCNGAKSFFSSKNWKKLKQIERQDLEDCVRCLLTENWTPAGVMAMRAIESAVREYYFKLTEERSTQWWSILDELKDNPDADEDLVKELDYIREHIRNPLAHPEDRIENHVEAEKAFLHAKEILIKIYS